MRANLDFFIGLRNKVEHSFARDHAALAAAVSGQAQAMLLNYEKELTDQFGIASSLATRLRFPVFIGSFTGEGEKALLQLRKRLPASLRKFLAEYHTKLGSAVTDDPRYELRLRVLQELAPKDPDALAIQYTRYDDLTDEERDTVEQLGHKAQRQDTLSDAAEPSLHHAPPHRSSIHLRDRSDRGGQGPADICTTLIASRGAQSWRGDLWITGRTLTPLPDREKPPSTTGAVGADPSRTTSNVAHRSVVSSGGCAACPRVRDS